jgi:hypothetical protein
MHFESNGSVVIDHQYDIEIYAPLILPGHGPGEEEYQYHVRVKGRSDGIGFLGTSSSKKVGSYQEVRSDLSLSPDEVLEWFLNLKKQLTVSAGRLFVSRRLCLRAARCLRGRIISVHQLPQCHSCRRRVAGAVGRGGAARCRASDGGFVLAELYVPCLGDASSAGYL